MSEETKQQFEREQQAYWDQREELVRKYAGKWVAVVGGEVVAVGERMNKAAAAAFDKTRSAVMFVACVGNEDVEFRIRQASVGYFDYEHHTPMPRVEGLVSDLWHTKQAPVNLIVDTGADITVLTGHLCEALRLDVFPAGYAQISGFDGRSERRPLYNALVHLATHPVLVTAHCHSDLDENILGRDVINEFALTVCAKRDQVEFEWVEE